MLAVHDENAEALVALVEGNADRNSRTNDGRGHECTASGFGRCQGGWTGVSLAQLLLDWNAMLTQTARLGR